MLPLKHLITHKETTIHIVPFTEEPQGKNEVPLPCQPKGSLPAPGGGKHEASERGDSWHCLCSHEDIFKKMLLLREASSVWHLVSRGWKGCHVRLKSLAGVPNEPVFVFPVLLGWLYLAGYCALVSRFCQVVISLLASVYSVFTSLSGRVQPNINEAIGIFLSDWANLSWSSTSDLI